jgi:hypothetical protein
MNNFWDKQRQKLQAEGKLYTPRQEPIPSSPGAWWAEGTRIIPQPREQQEQPNQHDFSKAAHLRQRNNSCPNCASEDFVKPSSSSAARCFSCGYIEGRDIKDLNTFAAMPSARTIQVRQTASAHGARMGTSVAEINAANASLEASSQGKAHIDS